MLKLLIIFAACIQISSFAVIDSNNCIDGANITTKCGYKINFSNIGNKSLRCILNFTFSNPTVKFNNYGLYVKAQESNKCPFIQLNITNIVDGKAKVNKLSTTCGGTIEEMERIFSNFSSSVIKLDPKGLNDQDSKVNMSLVIVNGTTKDNELFTTCGGVIEKIEKIINIINDQNSKIDENHRNLKNLGIINNLIWIIIIVVIGSAVFYYYYRGRKVVNDGTQESTHRGSSDDIEQGQRIVPHAILEEENCAHHGSSDDIEQGQGEAQHAISEDENYGSILESIGLCHDLIGSNK